MIIKMISYIRAIVWLSFIFCSIALFNLIVLFYLPLAYISPSKYRQITEFSIELLWPWLIFTLERLGKYKINLYEKVPYGTSSMSGHHDGVPTQKNSEVMNGENIAVGGSGDLLGTTLESVTPNESILLLMNHQFWCDFICGFYVGHVHGKLGAMKGFAKDSILFVPVVGTVLKAMGFVFLSRNWENDKKKIHKAFQYLRAAESMNFWLFTHPEGSRVSPEKLRESHEFAAKRNLPKLDHVLLPRVKGFTTTLMAIEGLLGEVVDLTIAYGKPPKSIFGMATGPWFTPIHTSPIDIYIRRYPIDQLPKTEEALQEWLYNVYQEKDKILAYWKENGRFPDGRPLAIPIEKNLDWQIVLKNYGNWLVGSFMPVLSALVVFSVVYFKLLL